MGRTLRLLAGSVLVALGLMALLFPFVSVWRLSGEVLDQLPQLEGVEPADSRHRIGALGDPEFVLARRVLTGVEGDRVQRALVADGFERTAIGGRPVLVKPCCGDYDAVEARIVDDPEAERVTIELSAVDGDIQSAVFVFVVVGLVLLVPGLGIIAAARPDRVPAGRRPSTVPT